MLTANLVTAGIHLTLIKTLLFIDVVKVSKKLHDSTTSFIAGTAAMAFPPRNYFIVLTEEQNEQLFA